MADSIGSVLEYVLAEDIGGVVGVYVYGSSTTTGLHHASDVDLLLLTRRTLSRQESDSFASVLLGLSGWSGHAVRFPHAANRRPLELTSLVVDDLAPLVVEPWRDFQFGEWLRDDLVHGVAPRRERDPDVVILLATALSSHQVLHGPPLNDIVADVPFERLRAAQIAALPALLDDLQGDERNVLLALARALVTVETGRIVAKPEAAEAAARRVGAESAELLRLAAGEYRGVNRVDWARQGRRTLRLARSLAELVRDAAERG